ncbi:hypothetical protein [Nitrosopumilus sp.]|uniref:hypothetical protein n=1 Tax=Nitrosopumilus sp. TaxID=2024843 RepID=UPI00260E5A66|nr:hypothetical protein [Nitrosopumilus sp.]
MYANRKLKIFKDMNSFSNHLTKSHTLTEERKKKIKTIAKAYLKSDKKKSFIELCYEKGVIF